MGREGTPWSAWASAAALFVAGLFPLFNADAYGHLAQGRQIVELGRVPEVDSFSFWSADPQPWRNYEWGYDWLSWLAYSYGGANALVLGKCFALALLGYLLVVLARRLALGATLSGVYTLVAVLLSIPVARFRFTVRPQIVGLLFPAVLLLGISELHSETASTRRKAWVVAGLAVLQTLWVNAHGSHLFGIAISVIFAVLAIRSAALPWMAVLLALQLIVTGLTPFGYAIVTDAIAHVVRPEYRDAVVEWAAWSPDDPLRFLVGPVIAALLVLVGLRPVVRGSRFGLAYGVLCVLLCLMAFRSMRFVAHQLLFCAPFVGAGMAHLAGSERMRRASVALVVLAAIASGLWTSMLLPHVGFGLGEVRRDYPWASARFIERHVQKPRVVGTIQDSWVLMFAAPHAKLLVDGRVPFYGPQTIREVGAAFASAPRFEQLLEEHDVNTVVIDHTRSDHLAATTFLEGAEVWELLFVEDKHSLFVRRDAILDLAPLSIVAPGYRVGGLLDLRFDDADVRREATRLNGHPNTVHMQAWHQGIEMLRPLARDGDRAGIRRYANDAERRLARLAYDRLSVAAGRFPGFTTIELYRAMAALAACDVQAAEAALARARHAGESRGTTLVALEVDLRSGEPPDREEAIRLVQRLLERPETREDPWVRGLAADVATRCD